MFIPFGFAQKSLKTTLGRVVYYAPSAFWAESADSVPLVFLHGFGGGSSAYEWSQVYPAFAVEHPVFAPDLPGWGRSEHPERNYRPGDYIKCLGELLEQLSPQRPVVVIASSLTAALIIRVAIEKPALFQGLILSAPAGISDFGEAYGDNIFAKLVGTPIVDRLIYIAAIATPGGITNFLQNRQFTNSRRIYPEIIDAYLASAQQSQAESAALSFVRGDLCFDLATYLPRLTVPSAILWGENAQLTSVQLGERLASLNPQAIKCFDKLPNVGLTPQLEQPALTIGLIRKYLKLLT
ncbi:MAG: alpha/beta hydrolase [Cyanobacteria bacterium P01_H01_bin.15]